MINLMANIEVIPSAIHAFAFAGKHEVIRRCVFVNRQFIINAIIVCHLRHRIVTITLIVVDVELARGDRSVELLANFLIQLMHLNSAIDIHPQTNQEEHLQTHVQYQQCTYQDPIELRVGPIHTLNTTLWRLYFFKASTLRCFIFFSLIYLLKPSSFTKLIYQCLSLLGFLGHRISIAASVL